MRAVALFCAFLVISLPLASFSALATALGEPYHPSSGEFSEVTVSDASTQKKPLVDRILTNNDAVIKAVVANDPVVPSELSFANIAFQSCQALGSGKSLCTLALPTAIC